MHQHRNQYLSVGWEQGKRCAVLTWFALADIFLVRDVAAELGVGSAGLDEPLTQIDALAVLTPAPHGTLALVFPVYRVAHTPEQTRLLQEKNWQWLGPFPTKFYKTRSTSGRLS